MDGDEVSQRTVDPAGGAKAVSLSNGCDASTTMVSQGAPLFVEISAERRAFSEAALQAGFRVMSVDHEVVQPFAPMVALDLTTEGGTRILWDVLQAPGLAAARLGLPCGVSSRARALPILAALCKAGVPESPPLRSAQHPRVFRIWFCTTNGGSTVPTFYTD